ncbi:response regulator [Crossiella sp. SN42]|nr:response regulator [Crossiella sp. SN42]
MTTVVLADDEALLRKALASLLPLEGEITVLAEAEDGEAAVAATLRHQPDVLVIDLEMPGGTDSARSRESATRGRTR